MAVSSVAQQRSPMRFRGRSYMAFALTPEPPIVDWLAELDNWIRSSAGFFVGRPVVLDLAAVTLTTPAIAHLIAELGTRNIRIMGIEGIEADKLGPGLPPLLKGGRAASVEAVDSTAASKPAAAVRKEPSSLLLEAPVRSGQSVFFPDGDVTVLGSVGSGAEVIAGGSIHIYGTLAGPRHGRHVRQPGGAHLLQQDRSGAAGDRRLLPHRGRPRRRPARAARSSLAQRRGADGNGDGLRRR